MNHGRLTLHEGLASARVAPLAVDAAVSGELAGIELECEMVDVFVGPQEGYRSTLTLDLSMHPDTMAALRDKLATVLPDDPILPFTEQELREISEHLRAFANYDSRHGETADANRAGSFADRIEEGLNAR